MQGIEGRGRHGAAGLHQQGFEFGAIEATGHPQQGLRLLVGRQRGTQLVFQALDLGVGEVRPQGLGERGLLLGHVQQVVGHEAAEAEVELVGQRRRAGVRVAHAQQQLAELRAFSRVVEAGGFSAAARSLGLSTAMVSKHVAALEGRLGVRLLDRNTRRSAPTAAGRLFYERCQELLALLDEAESELVNEARDLRGRLVVSMPPEFAAAHWTPLLPAFHRRHPQLQLTMLLHSRVSDLVEEGLDAALRFMRRYDAALPGRQLGRTQLLLAASPAYLDRAGRPTHPDDLAAHPGLCYGNPEPWARFDWRQGDDTGTLALRPSLVASSSDMVCRAAVQGLGIAVVTTMDAGAALRRGELERVLPGHELGAMGVYLVYPHRRHLPQKVRALADFLAQAFGGDPQADPFVDGLADPG